MPRSPNIRKKEIEPDPIYGSRLVTHLINRVMKDGKKDIARNSVYKAFSIIEEKEKKEPLEVFRQAMENIKPIMEVRSRRVGGAAYQVPMPVKGDRKESLGVRWLVLEARRKSSNQFHTFVEKLATEIIDAYHNVGGAIEKKAQIEKMADANKAFAHFRW